MEHLYKDTMIDSLTKDRAALVNQLSILDNRQRFLKAMLKNIDDNLGKL